MIQKQKQYLNCPQTNNTQNVINYQTILIFTKKYTRILRWCVSVPKLLKLPFTDLTEIFENAGRYTKEYILSLTGVSIFFTDSIWRPFELHYYQTSRRY